MQAPTLSVIQGLKRGQTRVAQIETEAAEALAVAQLKGKVVACCRAATPCSIAATLSTSSRFVTFLSQVADTDTIVRRTHTYMHTI